MKKVLALVSLAAVLLIALWYTQFRDSPPTSAGGPSSQDAVPVRLGTATPVQLADQLETQATAYAEEAVEVTARERGTVAAIHFRDNQRVSEGDVLVELEAANERAALNEAEAQLAEDRRVLNHYRTLSETDSVSRTMLEEQASKVAVSEAQVEAARATLDDLLVRVPFDGVLGLRQVSPGALVEPGEVITTLDTTRRLKLEFTAPEYWVGRLLSGQTLLVTTGAYPDRVFEAEVYAVANRVDPSTRALTARAWLDNQEQQLKPGMLLNVLLTGPQRSTLTIPEAALIQEGEKRFVYRLTDDDTVARTRVRTGIRREGRIEILSGLEAGQQVVQEGTQKVLDGVRVRVVPDTDGAAP